MTSRLTDASYPDSEDPTSFERWSDFLVRDSQDVPTYLRERSPRRERTSTSVPASQFTSRAFHDLEVEKLWSRVWQIAARENDIPETGDYIEYEIAGRSILLIRNESGSITAVHNACRHRGAAVLVGSGNVRCISCPFHGWTYGLDGALQHIPAGWDFDIDVDSHGLRPVAVDTFDGWIFVNFAASPPPLAEFLGEAFMRHLSVRPQQRMWKSFHLAKVLSCNWKVMAGGFFESYHVARTHPSLSAFTGDLQVEFDFFGPHHRLAAPTLVPAVAADTDLTEQEILEAFIAFSSGRYGDTVAMDLAGKDDDSADVPTVPAGATARQVAADMVRSQAAENGISLADASDAELIDAIAYFTFPNVDLFICPVGRPSFRVRPNGDDPNSCIFEWMQFVPIPDDQPLPKDAALQWMEPDEKFADYAHLMGPMGEVTDEDVFVSTRVQKGLKSLDTVHFGRTQEETLINFHHHLAVYLEESE